jgi:uncharacterized protein DUF3467
MPDQNQPEIIRKNADTFVSVYSNNLQMEVSPWDFKLIFGEIEKGEADPTGQRLVKLHVEDKVRVSMSPQHAKAVLKVLQENVALYEKQIGPIPNQPDAPKA